MRVNFALVDTMETNPGAPKFNLSEFAGFTIMGLAGRRAKESCRQHDGSFLYL